MVASCRIYGFKESAFVRRTFIARGTGIFLLFRKDACSISFSSVRAA